MRNIRASVVVALIIAHKLLLYTLSIHLANSHMCARIRQRFRFEENSRSATAVELAVDMTLCYLLKRLLRFLQNLEGPLIRPHRDRTSWRRLDQPHA